MKSKDYKKIAHECFPIIESTAVFIREQLKEVKSGDVEIKEKNSLVSFVDKKAEEMLVSGLGTILPEAGFITEEDTVTQSEKDWTWIIDPLDGTTNYLQQIPHFAISVALVEDNEIVVGIIYSIQNEECFYAWKDGGAYLNGEAINVSTTADLDNAIIATGFPYSIKNFPPIIEAVGFFIQNARGLRRLGAAALDLAFVACGRVDAYYEGWINSWDVAAGILIVREAGGLVNDFEGSDNCMNSGSIIAANPKIHSAVDDVVQQIFS